MGGSVCRCHQSHFRALDSCPRDSGPTHISPTRVPLQTHTHYHLPFKPQATCFFRGAFPEHPTLLAAKLSPPLRPLPSPSAYLLPSGWLGHSPPGQGHSFPMPSTHQHRTAPLCRRYRKAYVKGSEVRSQERKTMVPGNPHRDVAAPPPDPTPHRREAPLTTAGDPGAPTGASSPTLPSTCHR